MTTVLFARTAAKRLLTVAAVAAASLVLANGAARAQGMPGGTQMTPQQQQQMMAQMRAQQAAQKKEAYKKLGLSAAQITKLESIEKKYTKLAMTKVAPLQKKYGSNPAPAQRQQAMADFQKLQPEMMKLQAAAQKESLAVLTPAQRKKAEAMRSEAMAKARAGGGMPGGGIPGGRP